MYWNTSPASVTLRTPNTQVSPRRGNKTTHALTPCRTLSRWDVLSACILRISWTTRASKPEFICVETMHENKFRYLLMAETLDPVSFFLSDLDYNFQGKNIQRKHEILSIYNRSTLGRMKHLKHITLCMTSQLPLHRSAQSKMCLLPANEWMNEWNAVDERTINVSSLHYILTC